MEFVKIARSRRSTAKTSANDQSSRSHAIFQLTLKSQHINGKNMFQHTGTLNIVDLAGCERINESKVTGDKLTETISINQSLTALGNVITSLYNKDKYVPYRNSKLTEYLQKFFGKDSKTLMLINISPCKKSFLQTKNTLEFANKVKSCEGTGMASKNVRKIERSISGQRNLGQANFNHNMRHAIRSGRATRGRGSPQRTPRFERFGQKRMAGRGMNTGSRMQSPSLDGPPRRKGSTDSRSSAMTVEDVITQQLKPFENLQPLEFVKARGISISMYNGLTPAQKAALVGQEKAKMKHELFSNIQKGNFGNKPMATGYLNNRNSKAPSRQSLSRIGEEPSVRNRYVSKNSHYQVKMGYSAEMPSIVQVNDQKQQDRVATSQAEGNMQPRPGAMLEEPNPGVGTSKNQIQQEKPINPSIQTLSNTDVSNIAQGSEQAPKQINPNQNQLLDSQTSQKPSNIEMNLNPLPKNAENYSGTPNYRPNDTRSMVEERNPQYHSHQHNQRGNFDSNRNPNSRNTNSARRTQPHSRRPEDQNYNQQYRGRDGSYGTPDYSNQGYYPKNHFPQAYSDRRRTSRERRPDYRQNQGYNQNSEQYSQNRYNQEWNNRTPQYRNQGNRDYQRNYQSERRNYDRNPPHFNSQTQQRNQFNPSNNNQYQNSGRDRGPRDNNYPPSIRQEGNFANQNNLDPSHSLNNAQNSGIQGNNAPPNSFNQRTDPNIANQPITAPGQAQATNQQQFGSFEGQKNLPQPQQ